MEKDRPALDTHAVVGVHRLLQRIWRLTVDEQTSAVRVSAAGCRRGAAAAAPHDRGGPDCMEALRFNTSIARITELTTQDRAAAITNSRPRYSCRSA